MTLRRLEMSKNHNALTLMLVLANVFSSKAIRDASRELRTVMEHVAGKAEELTKAKVKDDPPQPFRKRKMWSISKFADWEPKKYATDRKASRDKRAEQHHIKVFGMQELGMVEYHKLMEEVDQMRSEPVDMMALVNKWIEELHERLEAEEKEKQERGRRQTQSKKGKAGTSSATKTITEPTQEPRKRTRGIDNIDKSRSRTGTKKKKSSKMTKKEEVPKTTGAKKPKPKTDNAFDKSEDWKKKQAQTKLPSPKTKAAAQAKKAQKTVKEDDDDDWLDDLVIVERKVPDIEEDNDDDDRDEDYELEEEYEDFKILPLRARKPTQSDKPTDKSKKAKPDAPLEDLADFVERTFPKTAGKKSLKRKVTTKQRQIGESKVAEDTDGTIPLFQQIVGDDYEVMASDEVEQHIMDRSINPVEAAGFRVTMKTLALGLKEAVKKGRIIDTTYEDLIRSTIEVARAMRYLGAFSVEVEEILPAIPDIHCNAWRKHLKGEEMMDPKDVVVDDEEEEGDDLLIQGPGLGKESTQAAAKAIHKLPDLLKKDAKANLVKLFDNQMKAHQYAAEACKNLKELHKTLPLEVFLWIADSAMQPLVIPKTEELCAKMLEVAEAKTRKTAVGASRVVEVMETMNLSQLHKEWTVEDAHKAKKMIACMVYKYIRDVMFNEMTAMHVIVDKFNVKQTTIHRQLYGKKYPGRGQTLE